MHYERAARFKRLSLDEALPLLRDCKVSLRGAYWAYREFYRWGSIARASLHHGTFKHQAKHFFYAHRIRRLRRCLVASAMVLLGNIGLQLNIKSLESLA